MRSIVVCLTCLSLAMLASPSLDAAEDNPARTRPGADADASVERFIVKLRPSQRLQAQAAAAPETAETRAASATGRMRALADRARLSLDSSHSISPDVHVMRVMPLARGERATDMLARLQADAEVEYVVPDRRVYPHATTSNDPLAIGQWYLQAVERSAIDAQGAWDRTVGRKGVVIAVVDTGVRFDHPDLGRAHEGGRLLPGYDFISGDPSGGFRTANDSDGRDADPSDPGDWVAAEDNCGTPSDSSWHGTRVAGIIGARSNNSLGVAGITWSGYILPVRVIGKCGGNNSDVLAGIRWAAGLSVPGVPANPYPAQVINVSLGSEGPCDSASADVISEVASRGVLVVVSAGNEGGPVDSPANCPGAMAIAGLRHAGTKVGFSSLGPEIKLSAPGGNCVNINGGPCLFSIDTTANDGRTSPGNHIYTDQFSHNVGTSFSSPIVSGIAGLMLAVNGNLKSTQLIARMQEGATKPFPVSQEPGVPVCHIPQSRFDIQNTECSCTTAVCGAGMANAKGAVEAALRPIAAINVASTVAPGLNVTLQAGGSAAACGRTITSYEWSIQSSPGTPPPIMGANTPMATVIAPVDSTGTYTVRLTVADDAGRTDFADVTLGPTSATTSAPAAAGDNACLADIDVSQDPPPPTGGVGGINDGGGGSGGGGGAIDPLLLIALLVALGLMIAPSRKRQREVVQHVYARLRGKGSARRGS